jgi:two-component system, chemotaxis family, CheB/CheR fusion protein
VTASASFTAVAINQATFPDLTGLRVLVVDDDADVRELFSQALSHSGAVVSSAGSATSAISFFTRQHEGLPDIVVTDLSMPVHDGRWLLNQIRSLPTERSRRVPVIAVTAFGREYSRERMLSEGFNDYLGKPIDPLRLCWTVAALTRRGRS